MAADQILKGARARTMAPAIASSVATFRNICARTMARAQFCRIVTIGNIGAADQCDQPGLWCKRTMGQWSIRPSAQCDNPGLSQVQTYYGPATDWHKNRRTIVQTYYVTILDWHKCKRTIRPTDKRGLWETAWPIRGAYMISAAYGSARNDKFCLY